MRSKRIGFFAISLFASCLLMPLSGCSSTDTKLTKTEEQNFKGHGQMSPEAQQHIAEAMRKAQDRMKSSANGPGASAAQAASQQSMPSAGK